MKSLVTWKLWTCTTCNDEYQGAFAYINGKGQTVCVTCLDFDIPEMVVA